MPLSINILNFANKNRYEYRNISIADFRPCAQPTAGPVARHQPYAGRRQGVHFRLHLLFAGNGEPTAHPQFAEIIDDTIRLRDTYCPEAKVSVLSNATQAMRPEVHKALERVDNNILKLDTVSQEYIDKVNRPTYPTYDVREIIETIRSFNGHAIVQTMFMRGTMDGHDVDNTGEEYVGPWLEAVRHIAPRQVMIYTIDRETPDHDLKKASPEVLDDIRDRVVEMGIECSVAY